MSDNEREISAGDAEGAAENKAAENKELKLSRAQPPQAAEAETETGGARPGRAVYSSADKSGRNYAALSRNRPDFSFALRGLALNRIIDCASPVLALIMRVSELGSLPPGEEDELHKHCCREIEAIELELHKAGYDRVTALAFRYCLCSVLDETVLTEKWGVESNWSQQSLLALYHQETWGGEKFFVIVERLMDEPHRYIDILEFLYLCMALGYQGKYRPAHNGRLDLETFMKEVHEVIRKERGYPDELNSFVAGNITPEKHYISRQTPAAAVIAIAVLAAFLLYWGFFIYTDAYTGQIIDKLHNVLGGA